MASKLVKAFLGLLLLTGLGLTLQASQVGGLAGQGLRNCGNEGERQCIALLDQVDQYNNACDSALVPKLEWCECLLKGPFGGCLLRLPCYKCRNGTRRRTDTTELYRTSWVSWALNNQRNWLAFDEPINWVMSLGTHNAFNNYTDGHQPRLFDFPGLQIVDAPNQFYSMTDQLQLGSRFLAIDAHWVEFNARLCHTFSGAAVPESLCLAVNPFSAERYPSMRYFANGIKEIRNWLADPAHSSEIVVLNLENSVAYLSGDNPGCSDCGEKEYIVEPIRTYLGDRLLERSVDSSRPFPSRRELLSTKKRVIVLMNGVVGEPYEHRETLHVSGGYPAWTRNNQDFDQCVGQDRRAGKEDNHGGPAEAGRNQFTVIVEDRTLQQGFTPPSLGGPMGMITVDDMRRVAKCNYTVVATDFFGSQMPLGRRSDRPDFSRHEAAVWSWEQGDKGQHGNCAMVKGSSGRWASADCAQSRRYVCAPPRSESGTTDRSKWRMLEGRWKVTTASGPWEDGPAACAAEFPFDPGEGEEATPNVFSVPVNGFQNEKLRLANTDGADLWINYTKYFNSWVIPKIESENSPPVADAGPDQRLECGLDTVLSGLGSIDINGDPLTYTWTGSFGTKRGSTVRVRLAPGTHEITLTVQDGRGGSGSDSVTVLVRDTKRPTFSVSLSPSVLSPDDGRMVNIVANIRAEDACDGDDVDIKLHSIVSSEPDSALSAEPDVQGAEFGVGDLEFSLRAERSHPNAMRVYTVTYRARDKAKNSVSHRATVVVSAGGHDVVSERTVPALGFKLRGFQ